MRTHSPGTWQGSSTTPDLPPLVVVCGATATGKTALAIDLAQAIAGAEIVSADSRQVYRGMDIGTAKPSLSERSAAPHHCLDLVEPDVPFSAADYQRHALTVLYAIAARGGVALLVGGTGLYLRAVARGLPLDHADTDTALRQRLNGRLAEEGLEALLDELRTRDPEGSATVDQHNPRRVVRALERATITGTAVPPAPRGYAAPLVWLGLRLEPEAHRSAIEARIEQHFEDGLIEEARALRERYPEDLPAFTAMGYREAFDVLAGRSSIDEAKARDAQRTWTYARRQGTWFRSEPDIAWLDAGAGAAAAGRAVIAASLGQSGHSDYAGRR